MTVRTRVAYTVRAAVRPVFPPAGVSDFDRAAALNKQQCSGGENREISLGRVGLGGAAAGAAVWRAARRYMLLTAVGEHEQKPRGEGF